MKAATTGLTSALAVAVALTTACNRGPDPTDEVTRSLKQANLNEVAVDWDGGARVAHLKGTVEKATDRQRAEEIAAAAVGTTGKVLNEVTIKGLNEKTAGNLDGDIKDQLKKMVDNDPVLRDRSITFEVNNGAVLVKGDVQTTGEKAKLTELLRAAPGVKDFANAVEIKPPKS
jgi:osmotically-inducible protein OsmY